MYYFIHLVSTSAEVSIPPSNEPTAENSLVQSAQDFVALPRQPPTPNQRESTTRGEVNVTVDADGRQACQSTSPPRAGDFSPLLVRPLPKASNRQVRKAGGRKRHTAILTDTPEKRLLLEHSYGKGKQKPAAKKRACSTSQILPKTSGNRISARKKIIDDKDDTDEENPCEQVAVPLCDDNSDDDMPTSKEKQIMSRPMKRSLDQYSSANDNCIICGEFGPGGEMWFRCIMCGFWAHRLCSGADRPDAYICDHCM